MQPRTLFGFFAAWAHCWLIFNLVYATARCFLLMLLGDLGTAGSRCLIEHSSQPIISSQALNYCVAAYLQAEKEPSSWCQKSSVCSLHHHGSLHFWTNRHRLCLPLFWYSCGFRAAESQRKVNLFPVTSDVAQSADILLQFFYLVTQISNQSKHSAGKDTISFRLNLSKRSQTVLAASEVKIFIPLLELSPSQGLCCTGVVAPVSAQTVPHRHCWAQTHSFCRSSCARFCVNWCANVQHVSCLCCFT